MSRHQRTFAIAVGCIAVAVPAAAQQPASPVVPVECAKSKDAVVDHSAMDHSAHLGAGNPCDGPLPTLPGQAAYGAIAEVVRLLKADPNTDWSHVNIEALRQHLIDMDDVTMHARVAQRHVTGGIEMDVTGTGRTAAAIKRMAKSHSNALDQGADYHATATDLPSGARITVTAKDVSNARMVAQIRGLGFAGLLTEGDHHAPHHIALARGSSVMHQ